MVAAIWRFDRAKTTSSPPVAPLDQSVTLCRKHLTLRQFRVRQADSYLTIPTHSLYLVSFICPWQKELESRLTSWLGGFCLRKADLCRDV